MVWPLANNQIAWRCRADLASGAARNRPARSSRLRCAATCTMLVSHEPWRVNLPAASPRATPAERIIRKPYHTYGAGLARILTRELGLPVATRATEGPNQNIELMEAGEIQLGFVTMGVALQAWNGTGDWTKGRQFRTMRAMFPM